MASGYPTSEEQAGSYHSPESFEHTEKHAMTPLEAGIIAGTVVIFTILLFLVFYCRHMEQRRRAQHAENGQEGRSEDPSTDMAHEMRPFGSSSNKQGDAQPAGKPSWSLLRLIKK